MPEKTYAKGSYNLQFGPNSLKSIYGHRYPLSKNREWSSRIYSIEPLQVSSGVVYPTLIETNWTSREGRWMSTEIIPYESIGNVHSR